VTTCQWVEFLRSSSPHDIEVENLNLTKFSSWARNYLLEGPFHYRPTLPPAAEVLFEEEFV